MVQFIYIDPTSKEKSHIRFLEFNDEKETAGWPKDHKWCGCPDCGECKCSKCNPMIPIP